MEPKNILNTPSFTIEIPDQGNEIVYIFNTEKAFNEWELTGRKTYTSTRPITSEDLEIDLTVSH